MTIELFTMQFVLEQDDTDHLTLPHHSHVVGAPTEDSFVYNTDHIN
jgi:hypothetical protein